MRFPCWLVVLAACGKAGTTCPTVDELMRKGAIRKEIEVVVLRCRADDWSASVVKCMRDAKDDAAMEPCFKALSAEQKSRLERAFAPMSKELDDRQVAEKRELEQQFQRELDERHLERLSARAPACGEYRDALEAAREATSRCSGPAGELELFGLRQVVMKEIDVFMTLEDDTALGGACARDAASLRQAKPNCN